MAEQSFQRTADGSLIMRRPQPVQAKPGLLAGLLQRLMPAKQGPRYWMPEEMAVAAREAPAAPPAPVVPVGPAGAPGPLPNYNGSQAAQWAEIENEAAKEQAIAEQLGPISKKILASKQLVEGKWFSP